MELRAPKQSLLHPATAPPMQCWVAVSVASRTTRRRGRRRWGGGWNGGSALQRMGGLRGEFYNSKAAAESKSGDGKLESVTDPKAPCTTPSGTDHAIRLLPIRKGYTHLRFAFNLADWVGLGQLKLLVLGCEMIQLIVVWRLQPKPHHFFYNFGYLWGWADGFAKFINHLVF
jgi:hypothetical protein